MEDARAAATLPESATQDHPLRGDMFPRMKTTLIAGVGLAVVAVAIGGEVEPPARSDANPSPIARPETTLYCKARLVAEFGQG